MRAKWFEKKSQQVHRDGRRTPSLLTHSETPVFKMNTKALTLGDKHCQDNTTVQCYLKKTLKKELFSTHWKLSIWKRIIHHFFFSFKTLASKMIIHHKKRQKNRNTSSLLGEWQQQAEMISKSQETLISIQRNKENNDKWTLTSVLNVFYSVHLSGKDKQDTQTSQKHPSFSIEPQHSLIISKAVWNQWCLGQ